jgi:hypothetical protein
VTQLRKGRDIAGWILLPFEFRERRDRQKLARAHKTFKVVVEESPEAEMNRILDKISAGGYARLSREEKEFLEKYSREQK